jgi:hypothetical protein
MGNHTPVADLMVGHLATSTQFWVNVKGLSSSSSWRFVIGADRVRSLSEVLLRTAMPRFASLLVCLQMDGDCCPSGSEDKNAC